MPEMHIILSASQQNEVFYLQTLRISLFAKQVYHIFFEKSSAFLFLFGFILLKRECIYAKINIKTKSKEKGESK